ncbi:MAG: hypothetical protein LBO04_01675 [Spirochaetaceae bacterium]|jgi:hypothetical protein|nr:hypothetical protein [Spirochaetaceae bacterium]
MLKQGVWYEISTRVNNREPLFRGGRAPALFDRVFRETAHRFVFAVRGLSLAGDRLAFYIKPADGFELPAIMDLFDNPVGYLTSLPKNTDFWQNPCFLLILSGCCSETEVSEQL